MAKLAIYLSCASAEHARARRWADMLGRLSSVEVVSTWLHSAPDTWTGRDHTRTHAEQREIAGRELAEVAACDVFWLLYPERPTFGAPVEFGAALALSKRVLVSGPGCDASVFTAAAGERFGADALAYCRIAEWSRDRDSRAEARAVLAGSHPEVP